MTRRQFLHRYRPLFREIPDAWLDADAPDKALPFVLMTVTDLQPLPGVIAGVRLSLNQQTSAPPDLPAIELGFGFYAQPLSDREDTAYSILLAANATDALECCHLADGRRRKNEERL